jgi:16S rRNA U516 pseudouridylate synthase RsuA-like enzyme
VYAGLALRELAPGEWRELTEDEVRALYDEAGLAL